MAAQEAGGGPTLRPPSPRVVGSGAAGDSLQALVDGLAGPARVLLAPGRYEISPRPYVETTCGNCPEPETRVEATRGLRLSGRGIELAGTHRDSVVLRTRAGYGILFEDCIDCALRALTVTDGIRDPDGNATDAAVVVKRGSVRLEACSLSGNVGDPEIVTKTVAGIMGLAGREGSSTWIEGCRIERNSWDGIALYRGARAVIRNNVVDGVDRASGASVGGGRGVGIGLTWDAEAIVTGNLVRRYWKGIGIFVDARAEIRHNVVEDVLTWGIAYWDAGQGRPTALIEGNVIFRTGACGASLTRESATGPAPGAFVGNALVRTGQDPRYDSGEPYCEQTALARHAVPPGLLVAENLFFRNREPGDAPGRLDISEPAFRERLDPLLRRLGFHPALGASAFLSEFPPPDEAARDGRPVRLRETAAWREATALKSNPDSPQWPVRQRALEAGLVTGETLIATTVHEAQVADPGELPMTSHDVPLNLIVTPERTIRCDGPYARPTGVLWGELTEEKMAAIPLLRRLRPD